jgi:hypothetical protein
VGNERKAKYKPPVIMTTFPSKPGLCPCRSAMPVGSEVGSEADIERGEHQIGEVVSSQVDLRYLPDERIEARERSLLARCHLR